LCRPIDKITNLVWFNGTAQLELRSVILKARRLADDHAERERAAAAVKTWLLAQISKKRAAANVVEMTTNKPFAPERLAA
jgi:hypothetical protein